MQQDHLSQASRLLQLHISPMNHFVKLTRLIDCFHVIYYTHNSMWTSLCLTVTMFLRFLFFGLLSSFMISHLFFHSSSSSFINFSHLCLIFVFFPLVFCLKFTFLWLRALFLVLSHLFFSKESYCLVFYCILTSSNCFIILTLHQYTILILHQYISTSICITVFIILKFFQPIWD